MESFFKVMVELSDYTRLLFSGLQFFQIESILNMNTIGERLAKQLRESGLIIFYKSGRLYTIHNIELINLFRLLPICTSQKNTQIFYIYKTIENSMTWKDSIPVLYKSGIFYRFGEENSNIIN